MNGNGGVHGTLLVSQPGSLGRWFLGRSRGRGGSSRCVRGAVRRAVRGGGRRAGAAEPTRRTEPAGSAHALLQLGDLEHLRGVDALQDELRDAVALRDGEVGVRVVEQEDLDLAAVVCVYDSGAGVDEVPGCCGQGSYS